jgi:hypothetical protein
VYEICQSLTTSCASSFVARAAVTGVTAYNVTGLNAGTRYFYLVRARDAAGNRERNSVIVQGTTATVSAAGSTPADVSPPVLGGALSVNPTGPTSLAVSWTAAVDNVTPSQSLVYELCIAQVDSCRSTFVTTARTSGTSFALNVAAANTRYYVAVRARDAAGNVSTMLNGSALTPSTTGTATSTSTSSSSTSTADVVTPLFPGVLSALAASASSANVSWSAASDNVTPASGIAYDICYSTSTSCSATFSVRVTATGVTTFVINGLTPNTLYYVVVRARDAAGNRETNTRTVSFRTLQ